MRVCPQIDHIAATTDIVESTHQLRRFESISRGKRAVHTVALDDVIIVQWQDRRWLRYLSDRAARLP